MKVIFCDHCGTQLEEHQHILSSLPHSFNLCQRMELLLFFIKKELNRQVNTWKVTVQNVK